MGQGWEHHYIVRYASNLDDGPWHGAPLGGFGAGCIGRSPRGDFNLWHLDGGEHHFQTFPACQFSVFEQHGKQRQAYALCTEAPVDGTLESWQWYPKEVEGTGNREQTRVGEWGSGTYHALYPRSWYVYRNVFNAELVCEQFSPIWAENYQEASYPVAVFVWTAHNPTDEPVTLSILLSWQNMVGWFTNTEKSPEVLQRDDGSPYYDYVPAIGQSEGNSNHFVQMGSAIGCVMDGAWSQTGQAPQEGEGTWAIATTLQPHTEIFYHTAWNPGGDGGGL